MTKKKRERERGRKTISFYVNSWTNKFCSLEEKKEKKEKVVLISQLGISCFLGLERLKATKGVFRGNDVSGLRPSPEAIITQPILDFLFSNDFFFFF